MIIYDKIGDEENLNNNSFKENCNFVIRDCGLSKHFTEKLGKLLEAVDDSKYCIVEALIEDNMDPLDGHCGVVKAEN